MKKRFQKMTPRPCKMVMYKGWKTKDEDKYEYV